MITFDVYIAYTGKYLYLTHGYVLRSDRAIAALTKLPYIIRVRLR
jgi:hypothetical protein